MTEMNRFLCEHKEIFNSCWHEHDGYHPVCIKCHKDLAFTLKLVDGAVITELSEDEHPNYTTALDYFALLQKAIKKDWWDNFVWTQRWKFANKWADGYIDKAIMSTRLKDGYFMQWLLAPENLSRLIALYFGVSREGGGKVSDDRCKMTGREKMENAALLLVVGGGIAIPWFIGILVIVYYIKTLF